MSEAVLKKAQVTLGIEYEYTENHPAAWDYTALLGCAVEVESFRNPKFDPTVTAINMEEPDENSNS